MTLHTIRGHRLWHGDCLDLLRSLPDNSVDSCVTDPPYGLGKPPDPATVLRAWLAGEAADVRGGGFMGREWDAFVPGTRIWREVIRVLKPGAHIACFAGQRTAHWMGIALSLAGFEIRDLGGHLQYQGFPKGRNVSNDIDEMLGAKPKVVSERRTGWAGTLGGKGALHGVVEDVRVKTEPTTPEAKKWEGWDIALKPAIEPWLLARKPLAGTVAANVLRWGTGALNIDAARYAYGDPAWPGPQAGPALTWEKPRQMGYHGGSDAGPCAALENSKGRWPANIYYTPKAGRAERERYCEGLPLRSAGELVHREEGSAAMGSPRTGAGRTSEGRRNSHPTVKPLAIMQWLCRLLTPPDGLILDPFAGSGTTAIAAHLEGFSSIGAEMDDHHFLIASTRIRNATAEGADAARLTATPSQPSLWGA